MRDKHPIEYAKVDLGEDETSSVEILTNQNAFEEKNMKPTDQELENIFLYHRPNDEQTKCHSVVSQECLKLAKIIRDVCPEGDRLKLALDDLSMVRMRANQAIACDWEKKND